MQKFLWNKNRVGNSLICSLLTSNERLWSIRSDRSGQMRDCERFTQVAHDKWANRSFFWAKRSFALSLTKTIDLLNYFFVWLKSYFFVLYVFVSFFFLNERFAHFSLLMSNVSESLRSFTKNEWMSKSLVFLSKLRKKRAIRSENRWANSQPRPKIIWDIFLDSDNLHTNIVF